MPVKFKNCFIDEVGNVYKDKTLYAASKELEIINFQLTDNLMDEIIRWKLVNFHDYLNHFSRVLNADLTIPIIIRADGMVMDGRHRILKAFHSGLKNLPAKQFKINPKPDFII